MMINIHGKFLETEELQVKLNNQSVYINQLNPCATFNLQQGNEYEIIIEQPVANNCIRPFSIILAVLLIFFRGLFAIIESFGDEAWYSEIKAFCIISKYKIIAGETSDYYFELVNSKYDGRNHLWSYPVIIFNRGSLVASSYEFNSYEFRNKYFSFAYRIISLTFIILLLFTFLLYQAFKNGITTAMILMPVLIIFLIIFVIAILILQYNKMKKLYYEAYEFFYN